MFAARREATRAGAAARSGVQTLATGYWLLASVIAVVGDVNKVVSASDWDVAKGL